MAQLCDERTQLLKILSVEAEELLVEDASFSRIREAPSIRGPSCTIDWRVSHCRDQQIRHPPAKSTSLKTDHMNQFFNPIVSGVLQVCDFYRDFVARAFSATGIRAKLPSLTNK